MRHPEICCLCSAAAALWKLSEEDAEWQPSPAPQDAFEKDKCLPLHLSRVERLLCKA